MKFQDQLLEYAQRPPKDFELEMKILHGSYMKQDFSELRLQPNVLDICIKSLKSYKLLTEDGKLNFPAESVVDIYLKLAENYENRKSV